MKCYICHAMETMENVKPLLEYIRKHVTLTEEEEAYLCSQIALRKYLKGQYILQQGDISSIQCFILSGCTKMFYVDDAGQEHVIMFSIEEWWTSDLGSFATQTPSDFNVQCIEPTTVIQFPYETHENLLQEIPKLERFFRKIIEKAYVSSQKRIIRNLSLSAKERYQLFHLKYPHIEQRIPQYMLASYLGITKEFLSKIKKEVLQQ
ncbi:Crp/Fnr family transcriptional regulator [Bizionia paragorgiae]|uniref:cAMP-binding domain of CRP or a regulatory subunit of cAMP-dependent protein kinases n=1 Tax=Bizionia paragorgiae TaxID=283786 RepID=A0A1H3XQU9_BIZPA|nr:Crp/Fnr family transcriptional regulator [Bizionia paragorgiae]SEA00898.1 cAMP-binding domain of CRP or a regulatory subunit of cAMP-dependent protein kinases [Bizionia paragorgiae]